MKTVTNYNPKTNNQSAKTIPQTQQVSTVLSEADYYDYEANLAQEKSDYFHMQYGY